MHNINFRNHFIRGVLIFYSIHCLISINIPDPLLCIPTSSFPNCFSSPKPTTNNLSTPNSTVHLVKIEYLKLQVSMIQAILFYGV